MTTLTVARVSEMPRVNLLPPEIAQAAKLRRLQMLLGLLVLGAFVIAGLLFMWASAKVGAEQDALDAVNAEGAQLTAEKAEFAEVPAVEASLAAAEASLIQAMAPEIRWSYLMNDLALTTPNSVRLASMTATNTAAASQIEAQETTATLLGQPTVGSVQFVGKAESFDGVAAWLNSLARQSEWYLEPTVSSIVKSDAADTEGDVYDFVGSASLSPEALSGRAATVAAEGN